MKWARAVWEKMQEPLTVSTDIEYELDMRLFPGLGDVNSRNQPSLMIHKPKVLCYCPTESSRQAEQCIPDIDLLCHEDDTLLDYIDPNISASLTSNPEENDIQQILNDAFTIEGDAESQLCDIPDFLNTPLCQPDLLCDEYSTNNNIVQFHQYINDHSNDPYISGFEKPRQLPPPQNRPSHQTTPAITAYMDVSEPPVSHYHSTTARTENQFRNHLPAIISVKDPNYTSQIANPYLHRPINTAYDHFYPSAFRPVTKENQPRSSYYESRSRQTETSRYSTNVKSPRHWLGVQMTNNIEEKTHTSVGKPINGASELLFRMANESISTTDASHVLELKNSRTLLPVRVTADVNIKTTESNTSYALPATTTGGSHKPTETVITSFHVQSHLHSAGGTVTAVSVSNLNTSFAKQNDAAKQTCEFNVLTSVKENAIDIAKPDKWTVKSTSERRQPAATGTLDNQRCADTLKNLKSSSPLVHKTETVKRQRTPRSKVLIVDMKFVTPKQRARSLKRNATADTRVNTVPVQDSVNKERNKPDETTAVKKTTALNDCFKTKSHSSFVSTRQKFKPSCFCEFYPSEVKVKSSPSKKPRAVHRAIDSNKKRTKLQESPETGNMRQHTISCKPESRKRKITIVNDTNPSELKLRSASHRDLVFMELDSVTKRRYDGRVPDQELVMY